MNLGILVEVDAILGTVSPTARRGPSHVEDVLRGYDEIDRKLVAQGFPPTSPWWRETIGRWYRAGRKQLVARVGRRGGKSSTLSRLGVAEALYGHHDVPPGDTGTVAVVSTRKKEAGKRLATIKAILDGLGVPYKPCDEGVALLDRRIAFCVYAASIQGVSGFTSVFVFCDEVSKWRDADTGVNPATEVLASLRPTMKTQPHARIVLSSSPFSTLDAHYDAFERGDDDRQVVGYAPSWIANPTITEAETIAEEPDERVWAREYKAVPQAEVEFSLLTEEQVDRAAAGRTAAAIPAKPADPKLCEGAWAKRLLPGYRFTATMDPATRTNAWTLIVAGKGPSGRREVLLARDWVPRKGAPLVPHVVLAEIYDLIAPYGLRCVVTDQKATDYLDSILALMPREKRIVLLEEPWTNDTKRDGYEHLLKLAQSDMLGVPAQKQVKADLLGIVKRVTRNGVTYDLIERDGRHADYAPAIAHAVADARYAGKIPEEQLDDDARVAAQKAKFLADRHKERERAKRMGQLPVTHRRMPGLPR
ncbi:MAG TPA: hypothetical protein VFN70_18250 [Burkholderiales bacterium]|nr:hypothetical protein [Burkholderiales bacterium]